MSIQDDAQPVGSDPHIAVRTEAGVTVSLSYEIQLSPLADGQQEVVAVVCVADNRMDRQLLDSQRTPRQGVQAAPRETEGRFIGGQVLVTDLAEREKQEADILALNRDLQRRLHEIETIF